MNTILKIAVVIVVIIIVAVLANHLKSPQAESPQTESPEQIVSEQPPPVNDIPKPVTKVLRPSDKPSARSTRTRTQPLKSGEYPRRRRNVRPSDVEPGRTRTSRPTLPDDLREKKEKRQQLQEEDKVQAERLYNMAMFESKVAKKPMMTYKRMVDYCRQIINDYPRTFFAPKARELLREMPERYRKQYNVTDEGLGLKIKSTEDR